MSENIYGSDVLVKFINGKQFILVGTAHISQKSVELVKEVIFGEKPDVVCIELDKQRYASLAEKKKWESLDLRAVIKQKQLSTLLINILLASYQKKLGEKLGVMPGTELLEAAKSAEENSIPFELCDRDVRITLRRAWNSMSFFQKMKFMLTGIAGIFEHEEITEEKLEEIKDKDTLNELMSELGKAMPVLKKVLIDERDMYLAQKIQESEGDKIVAVVGKGHLNGIAEILEKNEDNDLSQIEIIPKVSPLLKIIGWGIPVLILGAITYIAVTKGVSAAGDNLLFWFLANGIPCAVGSILAFGHPFTVLVSFLSAPFTSLTPVIGAGYVAAFVQVYFKPPMVKEFQSVTDDINKFKKWWTNKLLRILLVFILAGIGSALGTYVGLYEIIKNLF